MVSPKKQSVQRACYVTLPDTVSRLGMFCVCTDEGMGAASIVKHRTRSLAACFLAYEYVPVLSMRVRKSPGCDTHPGCALQQAQCHDELFWQYFSCCFAKFLPLRAQLLT
eukprot:6206763-Pleurochrysis_carterae.AAC.5